MISSNSNLIYFLIIYILNECLGQDCYSVDFNRIRILKTTSTETDGVEEWRLTPGGFRITLESNMVSDGWNSCSYTYSGALSAYGPGNAAPCTPPTPRSSSSGFYNCYMNIPKIYLTEAQVNAGVRIDVLATAGDYNEDEFDNGPSWDDINNWVATPSVSASSISSSGTERYGTRTGPEGRKARWFVKYQKTSDCNYNVNDFFNCDGSRYNAIGLPSNYNDNNNEWKWDQNMIGLVTGYIIAALSICIILISLKVCYYGKNGKNMSYKKVAIVDTDEDSPINV